MRTYFFPLPRLTVFSNSTTLAAFCKALTSQSAFAMSSSLYMVVLAPLSTKHPGLP